MGCHSTRYPSRVSMVQFRKKQQLNTMAKRIYQWGTGVKHLLIVKNSVRYSIWSERRCVSVKIKRNMRYSALSNTPELFFLFFSFFLKQCLTNDVTTTVQSLWTRSRRCTSRSLPLVYFVETVHVGLARLQLGHVVMVIVSSPTCMQRCTGLHFRLLW